MLLQGLSAIIMASEWHDRVLLLMMASDTFWIMVKVVANDILLETVTYHTFHI